MKNIKYFVFIFALIINSTWAEDTYLSSEGNNQSSPISSTQDIQQLVTELNNQNLQKLDFKTIKTKICFDRRLSSNLEWNDEYKLYNTMELIDEVGCIKDSNITPNFEAHMANFILKSIKNGGLIDLIKLPDGSFILEINFPGKSKPQEFKISEMAKEISLKTVGAVSVGGLTVGYLASKSLYKFDDERKDKYKHTIVGAGISVASTGAAYLLLEKTEWGKSLKLSKQARENIILLAGPLMGCLAGAVKEVYDSKHKHRHTVDFNDFASTCIGAGGLTVPLIFIDKNF